MQTCHWGQTSYVAVKLDMSKAYDRVDWCFLDEVMLIIRFAHKWHGLIMQCLTSVRFSLLINGQHKKKFQPSRGIRQGDHISPYLFIICDEALSSLLYQAATSSWLTGVPSSPKGHQYFTELFYKATSRD